MKQTLQITPKRERGGNLRIAWDRFSLELDRRTYVMGVLNTTPDSFSDGGKFMLEEDAVSHALDMAHNGADIIDVGGESTQPGSEAVSVDEELNRVLPVIEHIRKEIEIPISIDTSKSRVAEAALKKGASMVNDVTGLKGDSNMAYVIARYDVPVVVMHMKGTPRTMQADPRYDDLIGEIIENLRGSIDIAKRSGVDERKIIVDPGIGFGKSLEHNLKIIKNLYRFKVLGRPVMIGVSRKSFIGQILDCDTSRRLMGTAASVALSISNGANIIRVHDPKEMVEVTRVVDSICRA